jgi:hypothetical protein
VVGWKFRDEFHEGGHWLDDQGLWSGLSGVEACTGLSGQWD